MWHGTFKPYWSYFINCFNISTQDCGDTRLWCEISEAFPVLQGVRTGGVLSPHFYKTYINPLLLDFESARLGMFIVTIYVGCPTSADDLLLMSNYPWELKIMLDKGFRNSSRNKNKSCIMRHTMNSHHLKTENWSSWTLGETPMNEKENSDHRGLIRGGSSKGQKNVNKRINLARRTMYSLCTVQMDSTRK